MSSWAERVHRRAADFGSVVTSCGGHPGSSTPAYPYRLEKVKFGVPLEEVCKINDNIPGPLLVLILKLNKESPNKRDVFRAPGHQGAMKKLIHFLQTGRLVNVDNYSVYTIASVLKKFLRKIPNGIFGRSGEKELFTINELKNEAEQTDRLQRLFASLPKYTQHLLVLLFGTFRVIASNAAHAGTGMSSEALGVSVAPSFFQSCASDGKTARMEDVLKYKVATKFMQNIIDKFATHDLFGRDNYEYYARVTGRILKVQDEWICSFQYPPPPRGKLAQQKYALQHSLEAEKTWLQCQCERWGLLAQEESRSTPALLTSSSSALENSVLSLGVSPEHSFIESCARLSVSLEGPGLFAMTSSPLHSDVDDDVDDDDDAEDDDDFSAELEVSRDQYHQAYNLDSSDIQELDFDEKVIMRRYRQNNKKKTAPKSMQMRNQRQRRLRAGTKSLDSGEHLTTSSNAATNLMSTTATGAGATTITTAAAMCSMSNELSGSAGALSSANCRAARSPPMSIGGGGGAAAASATTTKKASKKSATRSCSRCNRGIRHASSCSSASGGSNNANGSSMTMDELRAVNRYAESTKSLSFLPQVHERQAERMRTRSEWFLGPQDEVVALKLADSCVAGSYEALESNHELIYQFFKMQHQHRQQQQQQQQQQHEQQQLNKSQPECMDIDESMTTTSSSCRSTAQFQHSTKAFLNSSNQLPLAAQCRPRPAVEHGQRRLLLDANTGSYDATISASTNYYIIHHQNDETTPRTKTNNTNNNTFIKRSTTSPTIQTLTTPIVAYSDNNICHYYNNNNHNNTTTTSFTNKSKNRQKIKHYNKSPKYAYNITANDNRRRYQQGSCTSPQPPMTTQSIPLDWSDNIEHYISNQNMYDSDDDCLRRFDNGNDDDNTNEKTLTLRTDDRDVDIDVDVDVDISCMSTSYSASALDGMKTNYFDSKLLSNYNCCENAAERKRLARRRRGLASRVVDAGVDVIDTVPDTNQTTNNTGTTQPKRRSAQRHTTTTTTSRRGGDGTDSNFVNVVFNVLDFLF